MLFFFSQTKYPFPGFLSGLNKSWRKRREKKSREKNERRGRKVEVTGGKAGTQGKGEPQAELHLCLQGWRSSGGELSGYGRGGRLGEDRGVSKK